MLIKMDKGNMPERKIYSYFLLYSSVKNSKVYSESSVYHSHESIWFWLESIYPLSTSKLCCYATDTSVLSAATLVFHQEEFQVGCCLKSSNKHSSVVCMQ